MDPNDATMIQFDCWSCSKSQEMNLSEIQSDRVSIDYVEIFPNPENPQRYHVRCPDCGKFNSVLI